MWEWHPKAGQCPVGCYCKHKTFSKIWGLRPVKNPDCLSLETCRSVVTPLPDRGYQWIRWYYWDWEPESLYTQMTISGFFSSKYINVLAVYSNSTFYIMQHNNLLWDAVHNVVLVGGQLFCLNISELAMPWSYMLCWLCTHCNVHSYLF